MSDVREGYSIEALDADGIRAAAPALAAVLIDCVEGGASVGFMAGLDEAKARRFWMGVAESAARDGRTVFVGRSGQGGHIAGTVQLIPAVYENQPHRADVAKMLVLRAARRRGLGAALLQAAEAAARRAGKTLLTLDTASDDAERLYTRLGWIRSGVIPDYALMPDGSPCATSIYYKRLAAH